MKKIACFLALCAILSIAAVSCSREEFVPDNIPAPMQNILHRYTFGLAEDSSRATLDEGGVFWEEGDVVGVYLGGAGNCEAEIDMDTKPKTVVLRSAEAIPEGTAAYAYYPFDENNTDVSATVFTIPHLQYGGAISAMPMAGVPFTVEEGGSSSTNGEIWFMNLASVIDFKIYSSLHSGEAIRSVTFQSWGKTIAGDAILNLSAIDPETPSTLAFSSWGENRFDYVTVRQNGMVSAAKDDAASIYMVLAPGSYDSGTITVVTDQATYTFPFSGKALVRNELRHYAMNLDHATRQVMADISSFPYSEPFTSDKGTFVIEGGTGNEISFTSFGAKFYGRYTDPDNTTRNHNVSVSLVSPWIDLHDLQGVTLSFDHIINSYLDVNSGSAGVFIIADGDDDWTNLGVSFPERPSSGFSDALSVSADLSPYIGHKIRIKFAYKSTTGSCGIWEVKDFVIGAEKPVPVYSLYGGTITEGDYVIFYNDKALKNTVSGNRFNYTEITPSSGQIINPDASIVWHIAPSGDYWTIYNAAAGQYAASTGVNNKAQLLSSASDDKCLWTVSGSSTYEFVNKYNAANGLNAYLRNNGSYGFACYNPNNTGGALSLYKLGYGGSSGGSGGQGGGVTHFDFTGSLACYEIPAVASPSFSGSGYEVLPEINPTQWYRYDTGNPKQKVVTHTFKNTTVSPNRVMRSYTLLQDFDKKCALWVACAMNDDDYPQAVSRKEKWTWDPALDREWQPNLTSSYPDKGGFSYDRGHQLAASYRETTEDQVRMTCYFTNMTPQLSGLNQGKWQSTVEANVRALGAATKGRDTLYVVSGPLFRGECGTVEDRDGKACARPSHYFQCFMKVSFDASGAPLSAMGAAYLVEHVSSPTVQYVSIDYVESLTDDGQGGHFDFFANVPAAIQTPAESVVTPYSSF